MTFSLLNLAIDASKVQTKVKLKGETSPLLAFVFFVEMMKIPLITYA